MLHFFSVLTFQINHMGGYIWFFYCYLLLRVTLYTLGLPDAAGKMRFFYNVMVDYVLLTSIFGTVTLENPDMRRHLHY